ncbi:MAG TPA: hypothetical protein VGP68_04600 [Gemmataceae bacterium]|nr:hypothetical protein [Gemmataceae bacterium]
MIRLTLTDSASDTETGCGSDSNANGVTGNNGSYTDFDDGSENSTLVTRVLKGLVARWSHGILS